MTMATFTITFHGPFHVARGAAELGFDRTIDREALLPASSLKGVMRAEAIGVLSLAEEVVHDVFGAPGRAGPWAWTDARFPAQTRTGRVARIRVLPGMAGQVEPHQLMLGEHVWASQASFEVELTQPLEPARISRDLIVLRACAQSLTSLGGARNRGEGWVTITSDTPLSDFAIASLFQLRTNPS